MANRFINWSRRHSGKIAIGVGVSSIALWELSNRQVRNQYVGYVVFDWLISKKSVLDAISTTSIYSLSLL